MAVGELRILRTVHVTPQQLREGHLESHLTRAAAERLVKDRAANHSSDGLSSLRLMRGSGNSRLPLLYKGTGSAPDSRCHRRRTLVACWMILASDQTAVSERSAGRSLPQRVAPPDAQIAQPPAGSSATSFDGRCLWPRRETTRRRLPSRAARSASRSATLSALPTGPPAADRATETSLRRSNAAGRILTLQRHGKRDSARLVRARLRRGDRPQPRSNFVGRATIAATAKARRRGYARDLPADRRWGRAPLSTCATSVRH